MGVLDCIDRPGDGGLDGEPTGLAEPHELGTRLDAHLDHGYSFKPHLPQNDPQPKSFFSVLGWLHLSLEINLSLSIGEDLGDAAMNQAYAVAC